MRVEEVNPYRDSESKGKQVEEMFDSIAPAYDFMNSAMSMGLHRRWRNKALKASLNEIKLRPVSAVLDIATGTGDVAFRLHELLPEAKITGVDLSEGMLSIARKKLEALPEKERQLVAFGKADCLMLPYPDSEFDMLTVAYGVRNFSDLKKGIAEMRRVLKPGGVLCIIELSCPRGSITAPLYEIYSKKIIPFVGRKVSGDSRAYSYLPESIAACPQGEEMAALLRSAGFGDVIWKAMTFGVVTFYIAKR